MYGLSDNTIRDICSVFKKRPNINEVIISGSRAKGNYSNRSDIDLAVQGSNISFNQLIDIRIQIEELGLLYKIDIVDYNKHSIGSTYQLRWKTFLQERDAINE